MSDSEADLPSEATISQKLRDVVIAFHKAGKEDDLTLKRVRARTETELSLPDGLLKSSEWKQKSKDVIEAAVSPPEPEPESSPAPAPKKAAKPKPKATEQKTKAGAEPKGVKRKAATPVKQPKKRRKTDSDDDDDMEIELSEPAGDPSEAESEPPKKKKLVQRKKKVMTEDSDDEPSTKPAAAEDSEDEPAAQPVKAASKAPEAREDLSESEMSSLIDESPKKKARQKKEPATKDKKTAKPASKPTPKPKVAKSEDLDTAEVKRLQGWLVKCGIRKVWSRDPELSKCDTEKEKIGVLKRMLKDVGMDGKYSVEKAAKIKEKREFEKDLAAIQEAEAHWGTSGDAGGRPRRRAAAAAAAQPQQKLVLSDDDDEEEGDDQDDEESSADGDDDASDDAKGESSGDEKDDSEGDDSE
ncbi:hypothetical protein EK21DRAFT_80742 [Setomelanomma holmii]|uniref:Transcriptional regulator n=1 Tax=Setomelanomma holmii TaxID=210430 RepID=A0A9P4GV76_9PLEO|nr:hypothetical protein EK21DRAFT_80742 [Setomelanomma holmii]